MLPLFLSVHLRRNSSLWSFINLIYYALRLRLNQELQQHHLQSRTNKATWCVPKSSVSDAQLQDNLDFAYGRGIDRDPIQPICANNNHQQ
jgi:hypothetical protein